MIQADEAECQLSNVGRDLAGLWNVGVCVVLSKDVSSCTSLLYMIVKSYRYMKTVVVSCCFLYR